ncbi:porphobilinogen synthase [Eubacteriales bacterium KG127]
MNRGRRIRRDSNIRSLVRETRVSKESLIYPIFLEEGEDIKSPIDAMPGQFRYSPDRVREVIDESLESGINKVLLFGIPRNKDSVGTQAYDDEAIVQTGIRKIKEEYGNDVYIITDVCMCEYTDHGHCGILNEREVDNDLTLPYLSKIALSHAKAGADMVAPSDMMDGRVGKIRKALDENGFINTPIMSYAAKYASAFYGPFRDAAGSAPSFGDRRTYQMDFHNRREALKECMYDVEEGADILMVKPALSYLDIIREVKDSTNLPLAAYSVSGEYSMIKGAGAAGLIDEYKTMCESSISIYRAGADILITYFARELAKAIEKGDIG